MYTPSQHTPRKCHSHHASGWVSTRQRGFTLIELMIVVVILGVIAAFAIPSYQDHLRKSKRSDARAALSDLAARQEQYFLDNKTYTDTLTDLTPATQSPEKYYNIKINAANTSTTTFELEANPTFDDPQCAALLINQLGEKTSTPSNSCW